MDFDDDYLIPGYNASDKPSLEDIYKDYYGIEDDEPLVTPDYHGYNSPADELYDYLSYNGFNYNPEDGKFYDYDGTGYYAEEIAAILGLYVPDGQLSLADVYGGEFLGDYGEFGGVYEPMPLKGSEPPEHSIPIPVDIRTQKGPKCSAYASSCLLRYHKIDAEPDDLYKKFLKLPDGSAIPSSVAKVIGAKLNTDGSIDDLKRIIDSGSPALVLCYYNKQQYWDNLHYILITGYDDKNLYIADSLHHAGALYYNRSVPYKQFLKMWDVSETFLTKLFYGKNIYYELPFNGVKKEK